ncbi:MAG: FtsX-like permease family protein [Acidobacteriota bacterium]
MRISTIAFANLRRRKGKALFLVAGMAIGIGTVVALWSLSGSIKDEIGAQLDRFGANIIILPQANSLALDYGGISVSGVSFDVQQLRDEDARRIFEIPYRKRLSVVAPKLLSAVEVEGRPVLLVGVDFSAELRLKRWWRIAGRKPEGEHELLAGYEAARDLGLIEPAGPPANAVPGSSHHRSEEQPEFTITRDRVRIGGREHRVTGVLSQTAGPEDRMLFGALAHVQALAARPGRLSVIEVSALCKDCPVEDIVAQIRQQLPHAKVSAIQQAVRARTEMVERLTRFSVVVSAVVLAIGALMIFTTMMGSVVERTREIGVLRAIGFRRVHVIQGLILEVAAISIAGGLLGWATGMLAGRAALPYFSDGGAGLEVRSSLALVAVVAGLLVGVLASIYPAIRASRLDPSEAVRHM